MKTISILSILTFELNLTEFPDILHQSYCNIISGGFEIALCIDPDDRLCIGCPQVHPVVIEFYLQPIFGIHRLLFILTLTPLLNSILFLEIK